MGNPGMRPLPYIAPVPAGPGSAPIHLTKAQLAVYSELVARAPPGLLQPTDVWVLSLIAQNEVIARKLANRIERVGLMQTDRSHGGMERQSAALKGYRAQVALLLRLYESVGLTPAARSGIHLPPSDTHLTDEDRRFQSLLG